MRLPVLLLGFFVSCMCGPNNAPSFIGTKVDNTIIVGSNNRRKINWNIVYYSGYVKLLLPQSYNQNFKLQAIKPSHTLTKAYWEINSTFFTFYDDGEKNMGGQITRVFARMCFVSGWMVCVCVCLCDYLLFFCHNDRSVWDTTGFCFMINSLHTICLMSCHHLCWKAPMACWCEYINTYFQGGKKVQPN